MRLGDETFDSMARVLDRERDAELWHLVQGLEDEKYGRGRRLAGRAHPGASRPSAGLHKPPVVGHNFG